MNLRHLKNNSELKENLRQNILRCNRDKLFSWANDSSE